MKNSYNETITLINQRSVPKSLKQQVRASIMLGPHHEMGNAIKYQNASHNI